MVRVGLEPTVYYVVWFPDSYHYTVYACQQVHCEQSV